MTPVQRWALITAGVVGLALSIGSALALPSFRAERQQLAAAQHAVAAATQHAKAVEQTADSLRHIALHADSLRTAATLSVIRLTAKAAHADTVFQQVAASAPDTCGSIVLAADSALADKDSTISALHIEAHNAEVAEITNGVRADSLLAVLLPLQTASDSLSHAASALAHAVRPSLVQRLKALLPKPSIGLSAGINSTGKPDLIAGVSLGWTIP